MKKCQDLTGQQFGEVTVLGKDEELTAQKNRIYWSCQCSCGTIKSIRADNLKKIQTCGNCKNNLVGQKFGRLTVLEKGKKDKFQHQFYICECECGNLCEINSDNLRRGLTQSCGCLHSERIHETHFVDITGQTFGQLTALSYNVKNGITYWSCQCSCGNICEVKGSNLKNGHTQSCGCTRSLGELNIGNLLNDNHISFKKEYTVKELSNKRFDFAIYNDEGELCYLIEYDGIQHFKYTSTWYQTLEEFEQSRERDEIKNQWCKDNHIPLIRIPYTHLKDLTIDDLKLETTKFRVC